ncbi:MAG TPA: hypothetical protein VMF32_25395 [Xanthobacteraceae bacterium]|nr:hypothetical protein [Xanthobacteraceae bacterium]
MSTATESHLFSNFAATQGPFVLKGGVYSFRASGTWNSGSLALNALGPDGSTYVPTKNLFGTAASLSANGAVDGIYLPPGEYQLAVTGSPSALYAVVGSVPG